MRIRTISLSAFILLFSHCAIKVDAAASYLSDKKQPFRIVGYVPIRGNLDSIIKKIDFKKLTHINVAFINPDSLGNMAGSVGLSNLIDKAHQENVKVLFSFGGGNPPAYLKELLKPGKRENWVANMLAFSDDFHFDGIDVDLEGDFIDGNYEDFITALSIGLVPKHKLLTAAVATWNGQTISDKALALFDFINVMAYDHTGPWNKNNPGQHSSYQHAVSDFDYWNSKRGVSADKLVLGLPYYGYGFGANIQDSFTYGDILTRYPEAGKADSVIVPDQGTIYYNGVSTITKKVKFVLKKQGGGVMIWQLLGDATGDNSLLTLINKIKN